MQAGLFRQGNITRKLSTSSMRSRRSCRTRLYLERNL